MKTQKNNSITCFDTCSNNKSGDNESSKKFYIYIERDAFDRYTYMFVLRIYASKEEEEV